MPDRQSTTEKKPRQVLYNDPALMQKGDLFTVYVSNECEHVEIKMAKGRIFRFRYYIHPFVFADHLPTNETKWKDSPWRLDIMSGTYVMKIPKEALFCPVKKKRKKAA